MKMVDNKTLVTVTGHAISSPQLRFERHLSVHKLFLNTWGEWVRDFRLPASVSESTHESLSNLSCDLWFPLPLDNHSPSSDQVCVNFVIRADI